MKLNENIEGITKIISKSFLKERKTVRWNLALFTLWLMKWCSCNLPDIAMELNWINKKSFNTNIKRIEYFNRTSEFQINDRLWRQYLNLLFLLITNNNIIWHKKEIQVNVDFTTKKDKFMILSASIPFKGRWIPLYFSMRNYPNKKGDLDQIKQETAFLKMLKHLLPNNYKYIIVADRGFGNVRFMETCKEVWFNYIVRTKKDKIITFHKKWDKEPSKGKIDSFVKKDETMDFKKIKLNTNWFTTRLVKNFEKDINKSWYIFTDLDENNYNYTEIVDFYRNRFTIEKMFQDEKSSWFNIEKSRLKKYSRFKKLLFCVYLAQLLMIFVWNYLSDTKENRFAKNALKKNYVSRIKKI